MLSPSGMMSARDAAEPSAPAAPSGLTANAQTSSSIRLDWTDNSNNETGFEVHRSTDGGSTYSLLTTTSVDAETYTDSGLSASTTYYYKVLATNNVGDSSFAGPVNDTTLASSGSAPDAPSSLSATTNSDSQIDLSWTDNSSDEDNFEIHVSTDGGSSYSLLDTVAADTTSYSHTGLSEATERYYKVRATNSNGNSGFSNSDNATTKLATPTAFAGFDTGSHIRFTWNDESSNEGNYEIYKDGGLYDTLAADTEQYDVSYANDDGTWKVRAIASTYPDSAFSGSVSGPPWPE